MASAWHRWLHMMGQPCSQVCSEILLNGKPSDLHCLVSAHFYPSDRSHSGATPSNHPSHPPPQTGSGGDGGLWTEHMWNAPSGSHVALALALTKHDRRVQPGGSRPRVPPWEQEVGPVPCPRLPTHSPDGNPEAARSRPHRELPEGDLPQPWTLGSGKVGFRTCIWHALLSSPPPPPLSPHLLLLQLPGDVNSLKLLIKNILLSPPKVCFPVIFLLERETGGGGGAGEEWRSGLPGSPWGPQGTRAWPPAPPPTSLCHPPQLHDSVEGGISEALALGVHQL